MHSLQPTLQSQCARYQGGLPESREFGALGWGVRKLMGGEVLKLCGLVTGLSTPGDAQRQYSRKKPTTR